MTIYTVGYAGWAPEGLRETVLELGATLVDVLIAPTSKSPQWRKEALAALMGPAYLHLPALATAMPLRAGQPHLPTRSAVAPIAALLTHGPVTLLCGCPDPHRCHRALAVEVIAERLQAEVVHLSTPARPPRDDRGQLTLPSL